MDITLLIIIIQTLVIVGFLFALWRKMSALGSQDTQQLVEQQKRFEPLLKDEMARNRAEGRESEKQTRQELAGSFKHFGDSLDKRIAQFSQTQQQSFEGFQNQLQQLLKANDTKMEQVRETVQKQLESLQKNNEEKLEKMRLTVDEKLHDTLEKRLGQSFKIVSAQLESVQKGLGEMQNLATGVGDLKKVLQNVKTRGTWGEIQLENLLEQTLTPDQFEMNAQVKPNSQERVDAVVHIPSKGSDDSQILLPIDAKFPIEDYQRLVEASEQGDVDGIAQSSKALGDRIKLEAKSIRDKYISPPQTTDFAILFLPIEGIYAELLRRPGFVENIQNEYRVIITGPMTVSALLNSLQMGFRTLAIEKRSSEVWNLLAVVKKEFGTFGDLLDKTHKKLQEAGNVIEKASSKSRTIERKLSKVESLSGGGDETILLDTQTLSTAALAQEEQE